ncbi:hypothetical protein EYF80_018448 [Liparis tanakae]|uniref:Uncharacterized protein n=1 Tax=Liparis tanakae TaxID=230148 RepID=A0A4Z2I0P7_9TELE|nr:hypothetical protein EYF80_018448 [Liparis tanakae]
MSNKLLVGFRSTHPLGVKVSFDAEAVDDTGGRQAVVHAGQQDQQQGQEVGSSSFRVALDRAGAPPLS